MIVIYLKINNLACSYIPKRNKSSKKKFIIELPFLNYF